MLEIFHKWYRRYLFEEESVLLLVILAIGVLLLGVIGDILAPILAAIVLAYLAQGLSARLQGWGVPRLMAVLLSYIVFLGIFFGVALGLLPLVWRQFMTLIGEAPRMVEQVRTFLGVLPQRYPELLTAEQVKNLMDMAQVELAGMGQTIVTRTFASLLSVFTVLLYMVLIPVLVFFFLKDREEILAWLASFLPHERPLLQRIWGEMNVQVANYARGKVLEMIIVGSVTYVAFTWLEMNYAALLALLVGLSVIIPYIGAALVTLPVVFVGFFQWGFSSEFYWMFAVYSVIQILDGNVLVPLLFSEAVNLHPVAIILAVLFFGGIWGMWGVFFAIPLATLIKAVINAWPEPDGRDERAVA